MQEEARALDNSIISDIILNVRISKILIKMRMSLQNDRYTYRITWSDEDEEYIGLCAEFPSMSWLARTPESALHGIRKAVAEAVIDMRNKNESPPLPLSSRSYSGKFVVRVPPEIHRELAIKAAEEGVSLNRLVSAKLSDL